MGETVPTGDNGRGPNGRFGAGNRFATGNPRHRQTAELRAALFAAVSSKDIEAVVATLVEKARSGDVVAIRELLDRVLGKPSQTDLLQRVEALEEKAWRD
jgi:hypothetical protein